MKGFVKPILALIFVTLIVFLIYWLWQRQPKTTKTQISQTTISTVSEKNTNEKIKPNSFSLNIKDGQVFDISKIKISGQGPPNSRLLIISNTFDNLLNIDEKGNFETDIVLDKNLNFVNITLLDKNLKFSQKQIIALYVKDKTSDAKKGMVLSGSVKNIFDNAITLSSTSGDKKIKKNNQTQISLSLSSLAVLPKNKQASNLKESDIRVGDYIIVLSSNTIETEILADSIEIVRENKPEITKIYANVKIASVVKNKTFSTQSLENNNPLNFVLDKNSKIYIDSKKSDEKAITKEKKALIFYTSGNDNIVSSIYILP